MHMNVDTALIGGFPRPPLVVKIYEVWYRRTDDIWTGTERWACHGKSRDADEARRWRDRLRSLGYRDVLGIERECRAAGLLREMHDLS